METVTSVRSFILEGPRPSLYGAPFNDSGLVDTQGLLDSLMVPSIKTLCALVLIVKAVS